MSKHGLSASQAPGRTTSLQLETAPTRCRSLQAWAAADGTSPLTSEESKGKHRTYFIFFILQASALSK